MSFVAALPTKTAPVPHATGARAALHATAAADGFSAMLDDGQAPLAANDASPSFAAKPARQTGSKTAAATSRDPRGDAASAARAAIMPVPEPALSLLTPPPAPATATDRAATADPQSETDASAPDTLLPRTTGATAAPLSVTAQVHEADVEEDGVAATKSALLEPVPQTVATNASAPGAKLSAIPQPPAALAGAGSPKASTSQAAAPLLQGASAAGATLVKAQATTAQAAARSGARTAAPLTAPAKTPPAASPAASQVEAAPADTASTLLAAFSGTGNEGDDAEASLPDDREDASSASDAAQVEVAAGLPSFAAASPALQTAATSTPLSASAADLAAQMAAKVQGGGSQFRLSLNPLGLGQVDVTVSIGADRQLTASLAFSDPQTAHALSAHAAELKGALEQAGFSVPKGGFDFTSTAAAQTASAVGANPGGANPGGGFGDTAGGQSDGGSRAARAAFDAGEPLGGQLASGSTWGGRASDSHLDIRI